jgi:acyl dehydratase
MAVEVLSVEKIKERVGTELGTSDWLQIDQDRINQFAECTNDHQWIHVDEEKAAAGPFGTTIAHGYLTLSLVSFFAGDAILVPENTMAAINYGLNKARLINPVAVDSKIRDRMVLASVTEKSNGRILVAVEHTVEIEGQEKPALVAEVLTMFFTG